MITIIAAAGASSEAGSTSSWFFDIKKKVCNKAYVSVSLCQVGSFVNVGSPGRKAWLRATVTLHRIISIIPTGRALFRKVIIYIRLNGFIMSPLFRLAVTYLCTMLRPVHFLFCSITSQVIGFPLMAWWSAGGACMYVFLRMIAERQMHYGQSVPGSAPFIGDIRPHVLPWKGNHPSIIICLDLNIACLINKRFNLADCWGGMFGWWNRVSGDEYNICRRCVKKNSDTMFKNNKRHRRPTFDICIIPSAPTVFEAFIKANLKWESCIRNSLNVQFCMQRMSAESFRRKGLNIKCWKTSFHAKRNTVASEEWK